MNQSKSTMTMKKRNMFLFCCCCFDIFSFCAILILPFFRIRSRKIFIRRDFELNSLDLAVRLSVHHRLVSRTHLFLNWLVWQKHVKLLHFPYNFFCIFLFLLPIFTFQYGHRWQSTKLYSRTAESRKEGIISPGPKITIKYTEHWAFYHTHIHTYRQIHTLTLNRKKFWDAREFWKCGGSINENIASSYYDYIQHS